MTVELAQFFLEKEGWLVKTGLGLPVSFWLSVSVTCHSKVKTYTLSVTEMVKVALPV